MNLTKMIAELREQKQALEETMIMLERLARSQGKRRGRPPLFLSQAEPSRRLPPQAPAVQRGNPQEDGGSAAQALGCDSKEKSLLISSCHDPPRIFGCSGGCLACFPVFRRRRCLPGCDPQGDRGRPSSGRRSPSQPIRLRKLRRGLWELRTYRGAAPGLASHLAAVFPRAGNSPAPSGNGRPRNLTYLIPFENLTARDRAWTAAQRRSRVDAALAAAVPVVSLRLVSSRV